MQGVLQADGEERPDLRVQRREELSHRQATTEPMSILPIPEVSFHGDEEGSCPGTIQIHCCSFMNNV